MIDLSQFGGYNDFPPGWREIGADEFAQKMVLNSFEHQQHRQMHNRDNPYETVVNGQLFFFGDETGVAVVSAPVRDAFTFGYNFVAEFYSFGCKHDYKDIPWDHETMGPRYSCDHVSKCTKCGHVLIVDSSD